MIPAVGEKWSHACRIHVTFFMWWAKEKSVVSFSVSRGLQGALSIATGTHCRLLHVPLNTKLFFCIHLRFPFNWQIYIRRSMNVIMPWVPRTCLKWLILGDNDNSWLETYGVNYPHYIFLSFAFNYYFVLKPKISVTLQSSKMEYLWKFLIDAHKTIKEVHFRSW